MQSQKNNIMRLLAQPMLGLSLTMVDMTRKDPMFVN